ncbi:hypothetical protein V1519DRAFT_117773 [Lipomyces tetrasporus]
MLAEVIWRKGADRVNSSVATGQRDARRMERFLCHSYLAFQPSLEDHTLAITLRHTYHAPYMDRTLSREVLEFVRARNAFSTPAEIYRDLQVAQPSGWSLQLLSKSITSGSKRFKEYGQIL